MNFKSLPGIVLMIALCAGHVSAQKDKGFSSIGASWQISSQSAGGYHFKKDETLIPYGAGISLVYSFSKKLHAYSGFTFRSTGNRVDEGYIIIDYGGYSGYYHRDYREDYFDIPLGFQYRIIKLRPLEFFVSTGLRTTIYNYKSDNKPDIYGNTNLYKGTTYSMGAEAGLIERVNISHRIGLFASQNYGYYLWGGLDELECIEFRFGLLFNLGSEK